MTLKHHLVAADFVTFPAMPEKVTMSTEAAFSSGANDFIFDFESAAKSQRAIKSLHMTSLEPHVYQKWNYPQSEG